MILNIIKFYYKLFIMGYNYSGVKFNYTTKKKTSLSENRYKPLLPWCGYFYKEMLAPAEEGGSAGNLSYRETNSRHFIITASGAHLHADMPKKDFVRIIHADLQTGHVYTQGPKAPSSETLLHATIYNLRPEIHAIFHGHSQEIIQAATYGYFTQTAREQPYGTHALIDEVTQILGNHNFIVMKNHGFIALGESIKMAGKLIEKIVRQIKNTPPK